MLSKLEYDNCMKISADASLMKMIPPRFLVTCTPFIVETPKCYGDRFSKYVQRSCFGKEGFHLEYERLKLSNVNKHG